MTANSIPTNPPKYPLKHNRREKKVIETVLAGTGALTGKTIDGDLNTVQDLPVTSLKTVAGNADKLLMGTTTSGVPKFDKLLPVNITTDAANADKVLMGTSTSGVPKFDKIVAVNIATDAGNADKLLVGTTTSGVPKFDKLLPANIATDAGNADKVLVGTTTSGVPKFDTIINANITAGTIKASALLDVMSHTIAIVLTGVTGTVATGAKVGDVAINWKDDGDVVTILPVATIDTNPHNVNATTDYTIFLRAVTA
jgi:hypothetical protein